MQHRYYIGLQLPEPLRARISQTQQALSDSRVSRKPLEPHITLLPPPAVERVEPEELSRQAKVTAQTFWPLRLTLTRFETYQDQAIVLTVEGEQIFALQKQLLALLPPDVEATYYPNPTFSPHVTLARAVRGAALPTDLAARFQEQFDDLIPAQFSVDRLTLFSWIGPGNYKAQQL